MFFAEMPGEPGFAYRLVADDLALRLVGGQLIGRLPPIRDLACEYGVAYSTMRRAMAALHQRGLVATLPGAGTFAVPRPAAGAVERLPPADPADPADLPFPHQETGWTSRAEYQAFVAIWN